MRRRGRAAIIIAMVVGAVVLALGVTLLIVIESERRATIEIDLELAQPFLALDQDATLEKEYGSPFLGGVWFEFGAVHVIYTPDDRDAMVTQVQATLLAEGWTETTSDGMEWHSGAHQGHRWGHIRVEDDQVRLFIGLIEG